MQEWSFKKQALLRTLTILLGAWFTVTGEQWVLILRHKFPGLQIIPGKNFWGDKWYIKTTRGRLTEGYLLGEVVHKFGSIIRGLSKGSYNTQAQRGLRGIPLRGDYRMRVFSEGVYTNTCVQKVPISHERETLFTSIEHLFFNGWTCHETTPFLDRFIPQRNSTLYTRDHV